MQVQPYLFFNGRCEAALTFYRKAVGAEISMLMRYKDSPEPPQPGMVPPGWDDKVMHGSVRVGDSNVLVSDGCGAEPSSFHGFALTLTVKDAGEAERVFGALGEGGTVQMPLNKTFFSPSFGMLVDQFGVTWMVYVEG